MDHFAMDTSIPLHDVGTGEQLAAGTDDFTESLKFDCELFDRFLDLTDTETTKSTNDDDRAIITNVDGETTHNHNNNQDHRRVEQSEKAPSVDFGPNQSLLETLFSFVDTYDMNYDDSESCSAMSKISSNESDVSSTDLWETCIEQYGCDSPDEFFQNSFSHDHSDRYANDDGAIPTLDTGDPAYFIKSIPEIIESLCDDENIGESEATRFQSYCDEREPRDSWCQTTTTCDDVFPGKRSYGTQFPNVENASQDDSDENSEKKLQDIVKTENRVNSVIAEKKALRNRNCVGSGVRDKVERCKGEPKSNGQFQCDECGKCYYANNELKRHKATVHTGAKPFKCDECGKPFAHKFNLTAHKVVHTGEKPHKCDVCGQTFTYATNLTAHKRTHTGEKPYICEICDRSFTYSSGLKLHRATHTAEKPYLCEICGKSYTRSDRLTKHKRTHSFKKLDKKEKKPREVTLQPTVIIILALNDDR